MSTTPRVVADFESQLATAIAPAGTTFDISSVLDDDGVALPNGSYCFTIDNGSSVKEYLIGDLVGSTVSSVKSVSRQGVATTGAARAHRVGASCIITDFVAIKRVADILAGLDTLDGSSPLAYDTTPSLSDGKQLATVAYVLSVVTGGTVNFSSQTIAGVAGETLAAKDPVYFKLSDQRWWKGDADLSATYENVKKGVIVSGGSAGGGITVQLSGIASGFTGLTPGAPQYLSNTGTISETPGTTTVLFGWAISATQILLDLGSSLTPSYAQKAMLDAMLPAYTTGPVIRVYAASATWSKPVGLRSVVVELVGGGGGSGGCVNTNTATGGGGGGSYAREEILAATLGATEAVTVGAGGTAGDYQTNGGTGGTSSFGAHTAAPGGAGSVFSSSGAGGGAAGGVATTGTFNQPGQPGEIGIAATLHRGGKGGNSHYGWGGVNNSPAANADGQVGTGYGGGASGAQRIASGSPNDRAGAAGTGGVVIVTEYYL